MEGLEAKHVFMYLLDYGLYVKDHLDDTLNTTPTLDLASITPPMPIQVRIVQL